MTNYARFEATIADTAGNVLAGATVEVRRESDNGLATLYSDRTGATPISNPVTADANGAVGFHVLGDAYKITATYGAFTKVRRYVGIGTAQEFDFSAGTTNYMVKYTATNAFGASSILYDNGSAIGIGTTNMRSSIFSVERAAGSTIATFSNAVDSDLVIKTVSGIVTVGPSTGQLAIQSNGSERIRVDNSGNVGIGTAAPGKTLDIISGVDAGLRVAASASSGYGYIQLGQSATATNNWHFGSENDGTFHLWNGNWGAGVPIMLANSSGNVGIGTTGPTGKLTVSDGTATYYPHVLLTNSAGGGRSWGINVGIAAVSNAYFQIYDHTGAVNRLTIDTSGNVGIGTTSPANPLDVQGSGTVNSRVYSSGSDVRQILESGGSGGRAWFLQTGNTASGLGGVFRIYDNGASAERMRIDTSGNVGIGCTPGVKLDVGPGGTGTTAALYTRINLGSGSGGYGGIQFSANGTQKALIYYDVNSDKLNLASSAVDPAITLTGAGNLGIGTASPGGLLEIRGASDASTQGMLLSRAGANSAEFWLSAATGNLNFSRSGGTVRMVIDNNGNLGIGTTSPGELVEAYKDVASNMRVSANNPNASGLSAFVLKKGATYQGFLEYTNASALLSLQNYNNGSFGSLALNPSGGGVSIGTTTANTISGVGFKEVSFSNGTVTTGTLTPDAANGNKQHVTNGGATWTLAPPAASSTIELEITNNASAGVPSTGGFTKVTGDALDATTGHKFLCIITKSQTYTLLNVVALQ